MINEVNNIKITIITVCFNAEAVIEKTIQSVISQNYEETEYIIIDGNSQDSTIPIIKEYQKLSDIRLISEHDKGIYDAMNKGIKLAQGDYIHFLNAGDTFYNQNVIRTVVLNIEKSTDAIYGNIIYCKRNENDVLRKYGYWCGRKIYFLTGDCINHQALFVRRKVLTTDEFNIDYQICADREWMMRVMKKGIQFKNIDFTICKYSIDENNVSIREKERYYIEATRCIKQHFPLGYPIYKIFDLIRNNRMLSMILHRIYSLLYLRKESD